MDIITLDFESYYDADFSLSKIQTDAYILDDRFETIMVGIKINSEPTYIISGTDDEIHDQLHELDWSNSAIRCHNTLFDGFILTQRYGIRPKLWMDTLSQGRMLHPWLYSHSLASLTKFYKLPDKGTAVTNAKGKRRADFTQSEWEEYKAYCIHDVDLCQQLGTQMDKFTTPLEHRLIDMTIRMFTEPMLVGDVSMMRQLHQDEINRKTDLLNRASVDRSVIMSNDKFAQALMDVGCAPPRKISARTGKEAWAFAKSDEAFVALQEHDNPDVQALVSARLGVKTTIAETRAERFTEMAERGPLCVYLNYWGAKTTGRYSGGNKVNWQNLPARGPSAGLRMAVQAPKGHKVLVGDSSNIELRMVMALAGQEDAIEKLERGVDMYCDFASMLFGRKITKDDKGERFLGKTAMLGLQYGAGAERFKEMVRIAASTTPGVSEITLDQAYNIVNLYRSVHDKVVSLWSHCSDVILPDIANGCSMRNVDVNGWFITQWDGFGRPGEAGVVYHDLKWDGEEWSYLMGKKRVKIYGAKVVENLTQHAAMKVVMWQTARINAKYPVKLSVHDEAVCVVPDDLITDAQTYMEESLRLTPKWCRGLVPVDCETDVGLSYGDAK